VLLLSVLPATGKLAVDFNPNLDFSKYKTFAFIGGVEQTVRMQLNPAQLNNQITRPTAHTMVITGESSTIRWTRTPTLGIELIDEKARDLAWRLFVKVRII